MVTKDNWSKLLHIPVKAVLDRIKDKDQTRVLKLYQRVSSPSAILETKEIGEVQVGIT